MWSRLYCVIREQRPQPSTWQAFTAMVFAVAARNHTKGEDQIILAFPVNLLMALLLPGLSVTAYYRVILYLPCILHVVVSCVPTRLEMLIVVTYWYVPRGWLLWIGHGLQSGPTLVFCCGCPISKPRLVLGFSSKNQGLLYFIFFEKSKNELVRPT